MKLYDIFVNFDMFLYMVLLITGLLYFKRIDRLHQSFFAYFILIGIMQLVVYIMGYYGANNHFVMPLLIAAQIVGLGRFYTQIVKDTKYKNLSILIFSFLSLLFLTELVYHFVDGNFALLWYSHFVSSIVFSLVSFLVLLFLLKNIDQKLDLNIHIAVFLYSSVAALVFLFGNILANIQFESQVAIWFVHLIVHIVFLFLIGYSLWKRIRS